MFGLYQESYEKMQRIFQSHPEVLEVKIYGSRAKGTQREGSDVDLAIMNNVGCNLLFNIKDELEEAPIPYLVDLLVYDELSSDSLKDPIDRVGKVFYKRENI